MTDDQKKRMNQLKDELKGEDGTGLINKKVVDETKLQKAKKDISLKMLQLAPETINKVLGQLKDDCQDEEVCSMIIEMIINRAWTQQQYTKLYAELTSKLGSHLYSWAEGETDDEKRSNGKKKFKSMVIQMVKKEFLHGFNNFKNKMIKVDGDKDLSDSEKFEDYNKAKKKLKGNINFISELYLVKYLPHKVIKFICYKLTLEYIKESIISIDEKPINTLQYPMHEEYIEALILFIENSGQKITDKERKASSEKGEEERNRLTSKTDELIDHLCKNFKNKEFSDEKVVDVISDEDRKEIDIVKYSFQFMEIASGRELFSIRLSLLFKNLLEQRSNGW